tara:strand:+ start:542 stop:805 length:264 start_codon:yes stop_codon:yes gene_type:complete
MTDIIDKVEAIKSLRPNASFGTREDEIIWEDERPCPTEAEISAEIQRLTAVAEEEKTAKKNLKDSAKAKLIAGEKLTKEEANILVGV